MTQGKFRKKPVVIEATQITDSTFDNEHPNAEHIAGVRYDPKLRCVTINTLEGSMTGQIGDWIIRGVNGELYPCAPDIFAKTYEAADTPSTDPIRDELQLELAETVVDSGMSGSAVERAEWFWAQLPVMHKWAGLETYEKALVYHLLARVARSKSRPWCDTCCEDVQEVLCQTCAKRRHDDELADTKAALSTSEADLAHARKELISNTEYHAAELVDLKTAYQATAEAAATHLKSAVDTKARLAEAVELIDRAAINTPEQYINWHSAARAFLAKQEASQ